MAITAAKLMVTVGADVDQATAGLGKVESGINKLKGVGSMIGGVFAGVLGANMFQGAVSGFKNLAVSGLQAYASYERLSMSLQSLTARELMNSGAAKTMSAAYAQAAPKAAELLKWIQQLAIESPFTQDDVAQAFKMAQAYGFTADEAKRLTTAMIDYASGAGLTGDTMRTVALALGQIQAKGKLAGQEVLQLVNAGIAVDQILAEAFGKTTAEIVEMREKGLIPADQAIEAIVQSLEEDFGGAAARSATTFAGLVSSLSDIKDIGLREFFAGTAEALKPLMAQWVNAFNTDAMQANIRAAGATFGDFVGKSITLLQTFATSWGGLDKSMKTVIITLGLVGAAALVLAGPLSALVGIIASIGAPVIAAVAAVGGLGLAIGAEVAQFENSAAAQKTSAEIYNEQANAYYQYTNGVRSGTVVVRAATEATVKYGSTVDATGMKQKAMAEQMAAAAQQTNTLKDSIKGLDAGVVSVQVSMDAVQAGIEGNLQKGIDAYTAQIDKLKAEYQKIAETPVVYSKKMGGSEAGTQTQGSNLAQIEEAMKGNTAAQKEAADALAEVTRQMIFQEAAAGLDAQSLRLLARSMGVMSESDYAVAESVANMKTEMAGLDGVFDVTEAIEFAAAMENMNQAVQNLVTAGLPVTIENIKKAMADLANEPPPEIPVPVWTGDIGDEIGPAVNQAKTVVVKRVHEMNMGVVEEANKGAEGVEKAYTEKDWAAIGKSIDDGILMGINKNTQPIIDAAAAAATAAWKAAMEAIGAESPSKKFALVGKYAMQGFAKGIEEFAPAPKLASEGAAMASLGAASMQSYSTQNYAPTVNVSAVVGSELDMYRLAELIANEIRGGRL